MILHFIDTIVNLTCQLSELWFSDRSLPRYRFARSATVLQKILKLYFYLLNEIIIILRFLRPKNNNFFRVFSDKRNMRAYISFLFFQNVQAIAAAAAMYDFIFTIFWRYSLRKREIVWFLPGHHTCKCCLRLTI